jgi:crossover junction endodeoxyribonuclease RusA
MNEQHTFTRARAFYELVLPYPVSANRYWRRAFVNGRAMTYVSQEAKDYKNTVRAIAFRAGIKKPIKGRVHVDYKLYPNRPQNWQTREKKDPLNWDDSVSCIDLDNAQKVLFDSLNGIAFEDDCQVFVITAARCKPDDEGARVVINVSLIE